MRAIRVTFPNATQFGDPSIGDLGYYVGEFSVDAFGKFFLFPKKRKNKKKVVLYLIRNPMRYFFATTFSLQNRVSQVPHFATHPFIIQFWAIVLRSGGFER